LPINLPSHSAVRNHANVSKAGEASKIRLQGLRENYEAFREHLWSAIRSGGVSRHASKPAPICTMSSAAKEAAEELINNGIFVSWGQLLTFVLLILCACMLTRCESFLWGTMLLGASRVESISCNGGVARYPSKRIRIALEHIYTKSSTCDYLH